MKEERVNLLRSFYAGEYKGFGCSENVRLDEYR